MVGGSAAADPTGLLAAGRPTSYAGEREKIGGVIETMIHFAKSPFYPAKRDHICIQALTLFKNLGSFCKNMRDRNHSWNEIQLTIFSCARFGDTGTSVLGTFKASRRDSASEPGYFGLRLPPRRMGQFASVRRGRARSSNGPVALERSDTITVNVCNWKASR